MRRGWRCECAVRHSGNRNRPVRSGEAIMIDRRLKQVWEQLQGKKPHLPHFLAEVYLDGIRGIEDLRVVFDYPVSVIAGGNATGKSTVLFAAACAHKVPGAGVRDFVPSTLFPDFRPKLGGRQDDRNEVVLRFDYLTPGGRRSMQWRRSKGWNRSFLGRRNARQPERPLYLRTMSNLSNPSEVRGVLSMTRAKAPLMENPLTASQIRFAQQVLPFRYNEVVDLSSGRKNLLFAARRGGAEYSELHMAAGERAILRLSQEIAQLEGALVLIDEVEAGLHPWVQQLLMLHLQQLALRRNLQVVVTSHSPVVLDSVPRQGRIFLDRDSQGRVVVREPYRDLVQDALYGRAQEVASVLCEDDAAEGILQGVFDEMLRRLRIQRESVRIGRDTGASEFPTHAAALRKFGRIRNVIFVLDGDARGRGMRDRIREGAGIDVPVLFLPGDQAPEVWVWNALPLCTEAVAQVFGMGVAELDSHISRIEAMYASAAGPASEVAKEKLHDLAERLGSEATAVCRAVGQIQAGRADSDIQPLAEELEEALQGWRDGWG